MLDIQQLRKQPQQIATALQTRGFTLDVKRYNVLEKKRKDLQVRSEALQQRRNERSKEIGKVRAQGKDASRALTEMKELGAELKGIEATLGDIQQQLQTMLYEIPNVPHASVPVGSNEKENVEVRRWGEVPEFDFDTQDHVALGAAFGMMNFAEAALLAGARFVVMKNELAKLHRALAHFMLELHTREHGYNEVMPPFIVNHEVLFGTGQLPKFADDQFRLEGDSAQYLIPTAEVPLTNLVRERILDAEQLPMRFVAHTPCFRREAGAYGKDTRGMIRQHQFEKVELVHVVHPDESYDALEKLTAHAETVLQRLALPYRVIVLCTGDTGFAAAKTFDLEVYLPGQQCYREISSCSNCEAFQARRMKARFRNTASTGAKAKVDFVHTLNGSGVAVGRALLAVLENYQNADGSVTVPEVLREYMGCARILGTE